MDNGINGFDELDEPVTLSPQGRKRKQNVALHAGNVAKRLRHDGSDKEPKLSCSHNSPSICLATSLTEDDLARLHEIMYSNSEKVKQDSLLLSYMDITEVKRRRSTTDTPRRRDMTINYFVTNKENQKIPVCKATFMSIFGKYAP